MAPPKRYILLIIVALVLITIGVSARLYQLTCIKFDIDLMTDGLAPIKQQLKAGSKIGYDTNAPSDGVRNEIAFILAPIIVSMDATRDTVLYIQSKSAQPKAFPKYQAIAESANEHYQFILLQRLK